MASKSFTLADTPESGGKGPCAKLCVCTGVLALVGILGVVAVYFYQSASGACSFPELDENGLSNWTKSGSEYLAYACFPGYFLEGESNLMVAKCQDGLWNPLPPACNSLPLRIDCHVNNQSLVGNITMWQESAESPTLIYGFVDYTAARKSQGHIMEYVMLSKRTCNISHIVPQDISDLHPEPKEKEGGSSDDDDSEKKSTTATPETHTEATEPPIKPKLLRIQFNSTELKVYRKAEIFMNIIFVDDKTTATLVSVHQGNLTLVMTNGDSVVSVNGSSWNWDKEERKMLREVSLKREKRMQFK